VSGFWPVSLLIDLDHEWWLPTPRSYTDTADHLPRRSRTLVHESIHYWQQLSHGYLLELAQEDWRQLLEWEQGGHPALGPRRERYRKPEGRHGFSAYDLWECEARFWEVLFVGPPVVLREAVTRARRESLSGEVDPDLAVLARRDEADSQTFDLAMQLSGGYAAPFRVVRELLGQRDALVAFPFLVHFALKSGDPVATFERLLDELAPALVAEADRLGIATAGWDDDVAAGLYTLAADRAEQVVRDAGGSGLLHAPALFPESGLADNPVHAWSFARLEQLAATVGGPTVVDAAICLPGFADFRVLLARMLAPPCVRFRDRQAVDLVDLVGAEPDPGLGGAPAAEALEVQARWETFQGSLRTY